MDNVNLDTFRDTKQARPPPPPRSQARPPLPPRSPARPRQNSIRTSLVFHINDLIHIFSGSHGHDLSKFERSNPRISTPYEFNKLTKIVERQDFSHSLPASPTRARWVTSKRTRPRKEFQKSFLSYSHPVQLNSFSENNHNNPCFNKDRYPTKRSVGIPEPGNTHLPPSGYHNPEGGYWSQGPTSASNPCDTTFLRDPFCICDGQAQQRQVPANDPQHLTVDCATKSYFDTSSDDGSSCRGHQLKWARKTRRALSWLKEAFSLSKEEKESFEARRSMRYSYQVPYY